MWLLPTSNSIPNVFVCSGFHPTWQIGGALFSSKPRRWARWSSPPRSRGWEKKKRMLVIWVLSATAVKHRPVLTEGCLVSGSALCPAVCLSLSKCVQGAEHHASTEWLTNPRHPKTPMWAWFRLEGQISASELVYCSPDEPKVHEIVALSHFFFFLYLFPSGHIRCFQFEAGCSGINSGCASCCRVAAGRQHHSNTCGCHLNLLSSITMFSFLKPLQ